MIIISLIIFFFVGYSILNYISDEFSIGEKIGLSLLIGIPLNTFIMLLLDFLSVGITLINLFIISILIIVLLNIKFVKSFKSFSINLSIESLKKIELKKINLVWLLFLGIIIYITYAITAKNLYWPTFAYDSVAGYDLMGKIISYEGKIFNSLFDDTGLAIYGSAHRITYPPMVPGSFAIAYLSGLAIPKIMISVYFISFLIALYFLFRKCVNKTNSMFFLLLIAFTPEMFSHAALSLTNLPQAIFASTGLISLWIWIEKRENRYLYLSAILLAINVWTRSDGIFFNLTGGLALLYYSFKDKSYKKLIHWSLIAFTPFVAWYIFIWVHELKAAVPDQQLLITNLFWDSEKLNQLLFYVKSIVLSTTYYGLGVYIFLIFVLINIPYIIKKDKIGLLFLILFSWFAYTYLFYQINYTWDKMENVLNYSYKRGMFCFMPLILFYSSVNTITKNIFDKIEKFITKSD